MKAPEPPFPRIHAVTVCHTGTLAQPWAQRCTWSWQRLGLQHPVAALSDGSWTHEDRDRAAHLGLAPMDSAAAEAQVDDSLARRPQCREIRRRCVLFRKIVDVVVTAPPCDRILFLDTDVLVTAPCRLPSDGPAVLYMLDDTSGYGGSWRAPLTQSMVCALNSGFLYYSPAIYDPDYLEWIAGQFLIRARRFWFFEQAAWAMLAGRAGTHGKFDGRDVRLFSGYRKRSIHEIHDGSFKWFPRSKLTTDHAYIADVVRGAKVIHFAGAGRRWFEKFADLAEDQPAVGSPPRLRWETTHCARGSQRWLLAARMARSELGK